MEGGFACKCLFFSFFPTLLKPLCYWCRTKLPSMVCSTGSCWVRDVYRGCWDQLFPAEPLQTCRWQGLWEGGLIQQTFLQ